MATPPQMIATSDLRQFSSEKNKKYSFCAEFREVFKNEIGFFFRALESGFLIAKRALGRNFLINFGLFFVSELFGGSQPVETAWYASLFDCDAAGAMRTYFSINFA